MWLLELILGIGDLIGEIVHGKRHGWGSLLWELASIACLIITVDQFKADHYILGTIGIFGCIFCFIMSVRRFWQDIRSRREKEVWKREQENEKEL